MTDQPEFDYVEITIRRVSKDDFRKSQDLYKQYVRDEWVMSNGGRLIREVIAVVNDLRVPDYHSMPMSPSEIDAAFEREYAKHKDRL